MAMMDGTQMERWKRCVTHGRWYHRYDDNCGYDQPFRTEGCRTVHIGSPTDQPDDASSRQG